ncbi:hypothetical protein Lalb_Chr17g0347261 [Lupinus albus]|uniref:Uncharacterized protein n=1 Tax=Lupinus albus TaxID=3870 RepID=A0A6A4NV95_LUPAL|nr:hypothetical protein Lalb_Chr17g0347261 [Lupinus albus]
MINCKIQCSSFYLHNIFIFWLEITIITKHLLHYEIGTYLLHYEIGTYLLRQGLTAFLIL